MKPDERLAVIDLGSNSFRLVVFQAGEGCWRRTDEIYEPVRIGEGLMASGRPGGRSRSPGRWRRWTSSPTSAAPLASQRGDVDAVATSAIRDAENAEEFLAPARERLGLPIRVLSREAEARYGYLAAVNSTTLADGCVLDLGGGSMQLVRGGRAGGRARVGLLALGTVRMSERFLPPNGPAKRASWTSSASTSRRARRRRLARGGASPARLVGIGGTVRNLAAAAQRAAGLPSNGIQGMEIEPRRPR